MPRMSDGIRCLQLIAVMILSFAAIITNAPTLCCYGRFLEDLRSLFPLLTQNLGAEMSTSTPKLEPAAAIELTEIGHGFLGPQVGNLEKST